MIDLKRWQREKDGMGNLLELEGLVLNVYINFHNYMRHLSASEPFPCASHQAHWQPALRQKVGRVSGSGGDNCFLHMQTGASQVAPHYCHGSGDDRSRKDLRDVHLNSSLCCQRKFGLFHGISKKALHTHRDWWCGRVYLGGNLPLGFQCLICFRPTMGKVLSKAKTKASVQSSVSY